MRFIKNSFIYLYKNFLHLFLFSLVPALFSGLLLNPFKMIEFVNKYPRTIVKNFGDIFYGIFDISWLRCLLYVFAIIILAIFVSVILGVIENHFRSGKRNVKSIKGYINNNILTVLLNFFVLALAVFVVSFLATTVIYLFHILFSGLNCSPNGGSIALSIIIVVLYFCANFSLNLLMLLNIPNMIITGYTFKNSIGGTFNFIGKNFVWLLLGSLVPFVITIPLVSIATDSGWLLLVNSICVLFSIMYYSSFIMVSYFDLNNLNRYDNRKYYNFK